MNIVILAAGKGSRMKSTLTKVLHHIGGKAMIYRVVETALILNPKKIFIVVSENKNEIQHELKPLSQNSRIVYIDQKDTLGTGHAVMIAAPLLDSSCDTLVLYGDVPLVSSDSLKILCKKSESPTLKVLTAIVEEQTGYGRIIRNSNNLINKCVEEKDASKQEKSINEINTGIILAPTESLKIWLERIDNNNEQNEYYLPQIILHANADKIPVVPILIQDSEEILGVNSLLQKTKVERIFQKKCAVSFMEQGLEIFDIDRFDVRGTLTFDTNVKIDIGCVFIGNVSIGKGVIIEPYCIIKNSSVGNYSKIKAFSHIENSLIGENSNIGPYSRLRLNSVIKNNCKIGNFVETKNTELNDNSKVNHLSYMGDAKIGKNVNIGAGTITCNYDGNEKHETIIEDDSFIGSNSELIAPVKIKKGAIVGAGTTLSKDAPENSLTVRRAKQTSFNGWKKSKKNKKK